MPRMRKKKFLLENRNSKGMNLNKEEISTVKITKPNQFGPLVSNGD